MPEQADQRPRIFWYELAEKWAIRAPALPDHGKADQFAAAVRQRCHGVFHHGVHAWLVPDDCLETARQLVEKYYRHYRFVDRAERDGAAPDPRQRARLQPRDVPSYAFFCSLVGCSESAPLSLAEAKALYRRAAARLHPDVGGSSETMASLNAAWRAIRDTLQ